MKTNAIAYSIGDLNSAGIYIDTFGVIDAALVDLPSPSTAAVPLPLSGSALALGLAGLAALRKRR